MSDHAVTHVVFGPEAPPVDVARGYLLAWNACDWVLEHELTAEEVVASLPFCDYRDARVRTFEEERGKGVSVALLSGPDVTDDLACVIFEKTTENDEDGRRSTVQVEMRRTVKGWRVLHVRAL